MGTSAVTVTVTYNINSHDVTYAYTGTVPAGAPAVPATVSYNYGATVPAADVPTLEGYTFNGWTGEVSTMPDNDVNVTGYWTVNSYSVSYAYTGDVPAGAPAVPATVSYNYGATVPAASVPSLTGYTFSGWSGEVSTMPAHDVNVTGSWTINHYTLTIVYEYADHSTASATHTEEVDYNASYSVTSPIIACYTPDQATVSGTMPAENVTVTVTYSIINYNIAASAGEGGSVIGGGNSLNCGSSCTVTATPGDCYNFVSWTENDIVVSTDAEYSFTVDGDRTLVANFTEWTLSLGNTPATLECINTGSEVVLTASTTSDVAPTYTWSVSSGSTTGTASGNTYTVSPTALSNTYTVSATVGGCVLTASKTVTVIPTITSISSSEGNEICMGVSTNLTVTSNATAFAWDNGAGSGSAVTVTPMVNTTYTVVATENTCTASSSIAITINTPEITGYDYIWRGASADWNTASNWYLYDGENYTVASTLPSEPNNYYIGTGECLPSSSWPTLSADATIGNVTINGGSVTVPDGVTMSIAGSLNGTLTAEDNSTIAFIGSDDQNLSDAATFSNVTFAQTVGGKKIIAPNGIIVNGLATFGTGVVSGDVSFGGSATATGASLNSYVDGTVTKTLGSAAFTFPIGSNGVLGEVDVPAVRTGGTVSMRFNKSASSGGFDQENDGYPRWWNMNDMCAGDGANRFHHVSNVEYWDISSTTAVSGVNFRSIAASDVHFTDTSINQRDVEAIKFAIYDGCWKNMGGTAAVENSYSELSVSGVTIPATNRSGLKGSFGSTDDETLLPIELLSFTATCDGKSSLVEWTTATERNNDYFVLERSDDAINFNEVARVAGAGNSIEPLDYAYTDYGISGGDNYYRLVQVDYDGTRTVSDIIVVNCIEPEVDEPDVQAYPNPFNDELTVVLDNFGNRPATVEVYDMLGKLIYTNKIAAPQNSYETILNLSNLPPAAYTVRVSTADFVINKNVVKN